MYPDALRRADAILDTFPYGGCLTVLEVSTCQSSHVGCVQAVCSSENSAARDSANIVQRCTVNENVLAGYQVIISRPPALICPACVCRNLSYGCSWHCSTRHVCGRSVAVVSEKGLSNGVPVVTLPADFVRGRFALAMYKQMGYTDLVAEDVEVRVQECKHNYEVLL